ncbi:chitin-binding protein [Herbihabitans rhizosphaerae]|uniref:Chitin-binding protein n=1 Tax=Herbihabitans rhizosphaerae TaxID=1872711 RepID=A0A4Q7KJS6_9PSEU|nr:lytic polysaccharide monooxygenase auxiliary activity family 9 protein [Herbihabitans rhizosphaerae]RZS36444.1 chitin-binding protein [Herbihabitans rhizosphaerae]
MKNARRRISTIFATLGMALVIVAVTPGVASAHGYVSAPPSRQAQCAKGTVECGPIKWEPQSVEGPKGLRDCHGGNAQFAELSDDSKPWQAASVGKAVDFTWTFTAAHRTSNFEYWIGGTKVGDFNGNAQQPPNGLTHNVDVGGFSGRQRLLAIWNVYDTANAFYACVDIQIN